MKLFERIVSCFLTFSIVVSLLSIPVHAAGSAGSFGTSSFWEWLVTNARLSNSVDVFNYIDSMFSLKDSGCSSSDGYHYWQLVSNIPLGTITNQFIVQCKNCGMFYSDFTAESSASDVYDNYVSTLPSTEVSSSDVASSRVYNLSNVSGKYLRACSNLSGSGSSDYCDFNIGGFPLSYSTSLAYDTGLLKSNPYNTFHIYNVNAFAGDDLTITYYFPEYSASYVSSCSYTPYFFLHGVSLVDDSKSPQLRAFLSSDKSSLTVQNGYKSLVSLYPSLFDSSSFSYEAITDSSGSVIGFSASGTLLYDLDYVHGYGSLSYSLSSSPVGYNYTSFDSFDDLTITVGSSGSSDSSSRLAPLISTFDNTGSTRFYLGTKGYDGQINATYDPNIFNETTKVFTEPVTGQQYLCTDWLYRYDSGLRGYFLALSPGTYIYNGVDIRSIGLVYTDDFVYIVGFHKTQQEMRELLSASDSPLELFKSFRIFDEKYYYVISTADCHHSYKQEVISSPTCTSSGVSIYTCSSCGDSYTKTTDALGHDWKFVESVPMLKDEDGSILEYPYTLYECSRCKEQRKQYEGSGSSGILEPEEESTLSWLGGLFKKLISSIVNGFASGIEYLLEHVIGAVADFIVRVTSWAFDLFDGSALVSWFDWFSEDNAVINDEFSENGAVMEEDAWAYSYD